MDEVRDLLVQILHGIKEINSHLERLSAPGAPALHQDLVGNFRNLSPLKSKVGAAGVDGDAIRREIEGKIAKARQSAQERIGTIKSKP